MSAPASRTSSSSRRRIGTQARTKSSRFGYAFADFAASHIRSPSSAGEGSVALICRFVIVLRNVTSRAMKPGVFGDELVHATVVIGRPSARCPSSKPCASSAMTPMYDLRHHSPSVTTSSPACSCMATA